MSWQNDFQQATTGVAFQLQLSRNMIMVLADIGANPPQEGVSYDASRVHQIAAGMGSRDIWCTTMHALRRRGLILHHPDGVRDGKRLPGHVWYSLTDAGVHVLALCKLAGLVPDLSVVPANSAA